MRRKRGRNLTESFRKRGGFVLKLNRNHAEGRKLDKRRDAENAERRREFSLPFASPKGGWSEITLPLRGSAFSASLRFSLGFSTAFVRIKLVHRREQRTKAGCLERAVSVSSAEMEVSCTGAGTNGQTGCRDGVIRRLRAESPPGGTNRARPGTGRTKRGWSRRRPRAGATSRAG